MTIPVPGGSIHEVEHGMFGNVETAEEMGRMIRMAVRIAAKLAGGGRKIRDGRTGIKKPALWRRWAEMRARAVAALAPALVAGVLAGAAMAQDRAVPPCEARCVARALIEKIPKGERIGLVPFGLPSTAIPRAVADDLYDRIARAMFEASKMRHSFINKTRTDKAWESWQAERETSDYQDFWNERRVGVTVHCEDRGLQDRGIALSCAAFPVGKDSKLKGDVPAPLGLFAVKSRLFPYTYTLTGLGLALARGAPEPRKIARVRIADREGQRSALTEHMEETVQGVVEQRFEARRRSVRGQTNLREPMGRSSEAPETRGVYELHGKMTWMDAFVAELSLWLQDGKDVVEPRRKGEIRRDWLPENLVGPDTGQRRYRATARAVVSEGLGENSAKRAVKNLARARVVAKALGLPAPKIAEIRSEKDGVQALRRTLDHGITTEELFRGPSKDGGGGWRVALDARVVKVGTTLRPEFSARLAKDELLAMEEIRIELSAKEPVHVAVFAWGADNKVVRLYPSGKVPDLTVPAGASVLLPRAGEGRIRSAPLPGNQADHEAFIVVAANDRLGFDGLAPLAGASMDATMAAAVSGSAFFERLAQLDLSHAAVSVLPYRVARR